MTSRKRTPDQDTPSETPVAVAEPPAAANDNAPARGDSKPTFAERVGQRKWTPAPDPFGIASDNLAGVHLFESKRDRQMAIKFDEKPSDQAVIDKLKDAGYHWQPANMVWAHAVWPASAMSTRIKAERLYQEVRAMIRQEKGIEASQEIPF